MTADMLDLLEPTIVTVAAEYGRRHHIHGAEATDFAQELRLWVIENDATLQEWHEDMDDGEFIRYTARVLRNEAQDYSVDIKAQAVGYKREDLYFYGKGEVKALLPAVFDPEKWHEPPQSEGRSNKSAAEGGGWIATLADVAQAIDRLESEDRAILHGFHRDGWNNKMMADSYEITESLMSYRHDRAIKRLVKELGDTAPRPMRPQTTRDPWRGRKAISAPAMRAYEQKAWDGE